MSSSTTTVAARTHAPAQPRRFIDGAARTLDSPFRPYLSRSSQWAAEIVGTVLALTLYGFGLGFLARWARTAG